MTQSAPEGPAGDRPATDPAPIGTPPAGWVQPLPQGWGQQAPPPQGWGQQAPPPDWSQQGYGQPPSAQGAPQQGHPPQQGWPQGYPPQPYQVPMSPGDEKLWGVLSHVSVPVVGFLGPLVIWLVFRDRSRFVADNSLEALNWSILATASVLISTLLTAVLIGFVLLALVYVAVIVFAILGALAANRGGAYAYPVSWRLVT